MPGLELPVDSGHADPTVCDPEDLSKIEDHFGLKIKEQPPEMVQFIVERSKQAGNAAFKQKNYKEATKMYSQAIAGDDRDHTLFGNRSAAYLALGLYEQAIWDANKSVLLRPDWAKGYYRLGCAYLALSQWSDAAKVLEKGIELEPSNTDMESKLAEARARAQAEASARRAQAETERRALVFKLRAARREDKKLAALNQFKQSMTAPDWELEDLEWRPTFLPAMKLKQLNRAAVMRDPKKRLLLSYLAAVADLAHPKQALALLMDAPRVGAFQAAAQVAVRPGEHVLVLGAGTGLLELMAGGAGAGRVSGVERSRSLYRMAKQALEANAGREGAGAVHLIDRKLQAVGVKGEELPPELREALQAFREQQQQRRQLRQRHSRQQGAGPRGAAATPAAAPEGGEGQASSGDGAGGEEDGRGGDGVEEVAALLPQRATLLLTDLMDYSVLGMGLLPSIDYAARYLLAPGARVMPQKVQVHAVLIEVRVGEVSGFDLSPLNTYRWYPHHERTRLDRVPHRVLSAPFPLQTLDLQARVDALTGQHAMSAPGASTPQAEGAGGMEGEGPSATSPWEWDHTLEVQVTAEGVWNAIAFWFDAELSGASNRGAVANAEVPGGGAVVVSSYGQGREGVAGCVSWEQAVQYVDAASVVKGSTVRLRVRQDSGQYVFTTQPPQCRPHHALVPRWHFDMVLDTLRNDAYDQAIRKAVERKREFGVEDILALDIGAGSGLLSMMVARAGANEVYGAEISTHMCDVGEETTIMNGFLGRVTIMDRDARRMDTVRKPDGTPPELPRRADLLVYEVFDSGLIGEGVLHLVASAKHKLLQRDASLVPMSATVYCQPIQMRVGDVAGWDMQQANRYRWRPDYEGVELAQCREQWLALAEPQEVFHFDFHEWEKNMQPVSDTLHLTFTQGGVFNAVAMWFELHLDEETQLSTSPYLDKGPTWQQAVQWVQEVRVEAGQALRLTAKHDTYSISYGLEENEEQLLSQLSTGVPLKDSAWEAMYSSLQELNSQLVRACVQNPLEYRSVAEAAVQFAARPHDLGLDVQQAVDFAARMMG